MPHNGPMARRRFFVPEIRRGAAELTGPQAEHLVRVLRVEPGQLYEVSDNRNLYLAEVTVARKSAVSFKIREKLEAPPASPQISLLTALIKFDRFEWLVEKATELGVSSIHPFEAARTDPGLAQASAKRRERWQKIALESSQQSRRVHLPRIEPTVRLVKALDTDANVRLLLDENPEVPPILQVLPQHRTPADRVALLLGPEGGWTDEEREQAIAVGWMPCSFGKIILRSETAAIAALAVIQAAWASDGS
ncbi:MAG: 16S rRNA (uracil(1498)-N(3))-methyltransferase [Acidobacteriaceae bacterium]|nr:16S rRNA (uracil(1498)-N(3))-methyltransferase [Acidobacteriaceae bacterium]MBV9767207.1 16S rRNA (uracil(1498)-N(3))-methyltransferase [Acidobacteriaceae bacterium]